MKNVDPICLFPRIVDTRASTRNRVLGTDTRSIASSRVGNSCDNRFLSAPGPRPSPGHNMQTNYPTLMYLSQRKAAIMIILVRLNQGELEGGRNSFWYRMDMELLFMDGTSFLLAAKLSLFFFSCY